MQQTNPFEAYPLYLKASDIADLFQVSENTAREMMRQSGCMISIGATGKAKRVPRDKFLGYVLELEGKEFPHSQTG